MKEKIWINRHLVDFSVAQVTCGNTKQSIEPKLLAVLIQLYEAQGVIVSQEALLKQVWKDAVVSPNTIQRCIAQLRKLFGDDAKAQKVIKTHPKLGYSLNVDLISNTAPFETKVARNTTSIIGLICTLLVVGVMAWWQLSSPPTFPDLNTITPVTSKGERVNHASIARDGSALVYLAQLGDAQSLVHIDVERDSESVLLPSVVTRGSVAISPDNQKVALGWQTSDEAHNTKCIQLASVTIRTGEVEFITPCSDTFHHSPIWLSSEHIVYQATTTDNLSQLYIINTQTGKTTALTQQFESLSAVTFFTKLAWLVGRTTLFIAEVNAASTNDIQSVKLDENLAEPDSLSWFDDRTLLITKGQSVYWVNLDGEIIKQQPLVLNRQITKLEYRQGSKGFLAILERQDSDIKQRQFLSNTDVVDKSLDNSVYRDWNAQYRPNSNDVAFLSERNGERQLWLSDGITAIQITQANSGIDDWVWGAETHLFYASAGALWRLDIATKTTTRIATTKVERLFQAEGHRVLMSIAQGEQGKVVWFDTASLTVSDVLPFAPEWAQQASPSIILVNDARGYLYKYTHGRESAITALPQDFVVQSIFVWRDGYLYVQDKHQNVWRYNPVIEEANIVGRYDMNALFLSDFRPSTKSMLTTNYADGLKELVWIDTR